MRVMKLSASRNEPNLNVLVRASRSKVQPVSLLHAWLISSEVSGLLMQARCARPRRRQMPAHRLAGGLSIRVLPPNVALCCMSAPVENAPRHVAIIMDGNGRWAKQRGL